MNRPRWIDGTAGQLDGEVGLWTSSGKIGLPPLTRVKGVGSHQQKERTMDVIIKGFVEVNDDVESEAMRYLEEVWTEIPRERKESCKCVTRSLKKNKCGRIQRDCNILICEVEQKVLYYLIHFLLGNLKITMLPELFNPLKSKLLCYNVDNPDTVYVTLGNTTVRTSLHEKHFRQFY